MLPAVLIVRARLSPFGEGSRTGVLLYAPDSSITLTYLAMLLFCIVAVSTGSLAIYAPAFYILSIMVVTPFVVRTFIGGSAFELALGIPIAINTDAHSEEDMDMLPYGVATARRAWIEAKDVINCWTKDKLLKWLKS